MLINRYYVVYADVPSGYVGVETVDAPKKDFALMRKMVMAMHDERSCAVLYILEGR